MQTHISIPEGITLVVLDLDGTLYRKPHMSWHMIRRQWRHLPSMIAERRWRKAHRRALEKGEPIPPMPVDEHWYYTAYLPTMVQIIAEYYTAQPWVQPLLDECRSRGIKRVLLSDYEAELDKLRVLHLNPDDFDCILSTGDLGTIKPDPRLGEMILQHLYPRQSRVADWQHALFIGDRPDTDGKLAQALGAQFIQV